MIDAEALAATASAGGRGPAQGRALNEWPRPATTALQAAKAEAGQDVADGRGLPRRAAPDDQRGLRHEDRRDPDQARPSEMREAVEDYERAHGRAAGPARGRVAEARRELPGPQGEDPRPPRDRLDDAGDPLARGDGAGSGPRSTRSRARSTPSAPRWDDPAWADRPFPKPLAADAPVRRDPASTSTSSPAGVPADPRLREGIPTRFTFPALLPFPDRSNLLIEAPTEGRAAAIEVLRSAMLRLLTSLPPGQVRFTIVDPVGIGRNFGAFMHLADFDEALVTGQVWTDPRQIDERLADLAAHMEKVTQKYLRNEYATIDEYNAVAGEVAEPYRVLVVADFPADFDEKSAARLAEIVAEGVPCGVLTLIARRPRPPARPSASPLDDLRPHASRPRLGRRPARLGRPRLRPLSRSILDAPPPAELATRLIQQRRRLGQGRQAGRGPVRLHRPGRRRLVDARQPDRDRRPARQGGRDQAAAPDARPRHVAARPDRRPDRLGQVDAAACPDHQPRAELQPRRGRPLPDRLQEGGRVQGLRHPRPAPRQRRRDRERARVRHQRPPAARRRDARPRPTGSATRASRTSTATGTPPGTPPLPRMPADRRRVPGVLRRGGQARPGGRAAARPPRPPGPGVRRPRPTSARRRSAGPTPWPGAPSARWPCGSRSSAARPTPT